jgi:hypothetical protein
VLISSGQRSSRGASSSPGFEYGSKKLGEERIETVRGMGYRLRSGE